MRKPIFQDLPPFLCAGSRRRSQGLGLVGWLVAVPVTLLMLLATVVAFYEGRKAYWDAQVREMCAKDGGVKIFDKLHIAKKDVGLLEKVDGKFDVTTKRLASYNAPAYSEIKTTSVQEGNPSVDRTEVAITRRVDGATVASWVSYARFGGDFPTYAHPSSFRCPEMRKITTDLQPLFVLEGKPNE